MFLTLEEVKNGAVMVLVMICTPLDLTVLTFGLEDDVPLSWNKFLRSLLFVKVM